MLRKKSQLRTAKATKAKRVQPIKPRSTPKKITKPKKKECEECVELFTSAPLDKTFRTLEGSMLKDIKELAHDLEKMNRVAFEHHVNSMKNDFSKWTKDVLGEEDLSKAIEKIKDKDKMTIIVLKHIVKKLEDKNKKKKK